MKTLSVLTPSRSHITPIFDMPKGSRSLSTTMSMQWRRTAFCFLALFHPGKGAWEPHPINQPCMKRWYALPRTEYTNHEGLTGILWRLGTIASIVWELGENWAITSYKCWYLLITNVPAMPLNGKVSAVRHLWTVPRWWTAWILHQRSATRPRTRWRLW